ncbi:kinase-like domain-containing protein, partial [Mycena pura]
MSHWFSSSDLPDLTGAFVDEGFLQLVELLNCGSFAKVYKALDTTSPLDDPAFYAVKCMRNAPYDSDRWYDLQNEFSLHDAVSDLPGVVSFRRTFTDGELVFMVLDLVPHTMLHCIVSRAVYVDRPMLAKDAFFELLDVVDQCHRNGVYHCDIKPANILCNADGLGIRLADFGMATREEHLRDFGCGTEPYMAPECVSRSRGSHSARAVDLWALAMTLFNLVTGTVPWSVAALSDPRYAAFRADPDAYLRDTYHLSPAASDLFRWCFDADPAARPSVEQTRAAVLDIDQFSL